MARTLIKIYPDLYPNMSTVIRAGVSRLYHERVKGEFMVFPSPSIEEKQLAKLKPGESTSR